MSEFVPDILRFESLPSTNTEAMKRATEGAAEGLCVVAGEQTAGRGRLQRQWLSPKDAGLYFSIVLRPRLEQASWPLLTLMAAVAVHDALLETCALTTDIKWPNDILANEKKLCGILAETVETPLGRAAIVGIGINLTDRSFPTELESVATSVEACTSRRPDLEVVLAGLARSLGKHYVALHDSNGPDAVVSRWCARSSYAQGKRVRVSEANESFVGTTRGLEPDGSLRVETGYGIRGEIRIVRAGDVTSLRASEAAGASPPSRP
jgi:BirA family biotin operon repressor/biotin-[acetyl-CoA-carboxylase] ligase